MATLTPTCAAQAARLAIRNMNILASLELERALAELCNEDGSALTASEHTGAAIRILAALGNAQDQINAMRDGGRT